MSTQVKICGVTTVGDALHAVAAGADMIGLMLYARSSRYITLATAAEIARALPPKVLRVGVFADPTENDVREAIQACGLNLLQFHGNESPEFCLQFGVRSVKAFRIRDQSSLAALAQYHTDAFLLDAHSASGLGGTGEKFNWDLAIQAKDFGRPIILAGGLTPANVAAAIAQVHPYAVDVSSGVESAPGKKDPAKVTTFIQTAKSVK